MSSHTMVKINGCMNNKLIMTLGFLFSFCTCTFAQKGDKGVFVEVWGPSVGVGVSYDARVKPGSKLGYRVGLATNFSGWYWPSLLKNGKRQISLTAPIGANYLIPVAHKGESSVEIGVGTNLGIYRNEGHRWVGDRVGPGDGIADMENIRMENFKENTFGYFMYGSIGYRYSPRNGGFQFRGGISPSFNFGDKHGVDTKELIVYYSIGYTF